MVLSRLSFCEWLVTDAQSIESVYLLHLFGLTRHEAEWCAWASLEALHSFGSVAWLLGYKVLINVVLGASGYAVLWGDDAVAFSDYVLNKNR